MERDIARTKAQIETARSNLLFSQSGNDPEMRKVVETKMEYLHGLQKRKVEMEMNWAKAALLLQKLTECDVYYSDMTDEENVMLWHPSVQRIDVNFDSIRATVLWTFSSIVSH